MWSLVSRRPIPGKLKTRRGRFLRPSPGKGLVAECASSSLNGRALMPGSVSSCGYVMTHYSHTIMHV
jgi:hypothetical protein